VLATLSPGCSHLFKPAGNPRIFVANAPGMKGEHPLRIGPSNLRQSYAACPFLDRPPYLAVENEKEDAMDQQQPPPFHGTGAEIYECSLVPAVFAPWAALLIEQAKLQPGERVLDVACGTGVVARRAAQHIGPTGKVIGLELHADMLAVARSLPELPGASIGWQEGNALALPFSDETFDVVLCQQGLQFFSDRPAALREMHRVLVPGGRVVLSIWGPLERNPGHAALVRALERHLDTAAASAMRSCFALGEVREVRSLLAGGLFRQVHLHTAVLTVRFASPEQFVWLEMIPSHLENPVAKMDVHALSVLVSEVNAALQPYVTSDALAFPMQAHLVIARK
jgi:SAM-dependent methyltransferase